MVHGSMVDLTLIKAHWSCYGLLLDFAHTFGAKTISFAFYLALGALSFGHLVQS